MPFYFKHVCDLLSTLDLISRRDPPYLPAVKRGKQRESLHHWFCTHRAAIDASSNLQLAVFSAILPEKRPDRVYNIQYSRLVGLLKRCLCLGVERQQMLDHWSIPGRGDLADCVERVMQQTDDPLTLALTMVTLEEVDTALAITASKSRFSGPKIRECEVDNNIQTSLQNIFRRLHSREAKWLTRTILKDFLRLDLKASVVFSAFDPRLPKAMEMYDNMEVALQEHKQLLVSDEAADLRNESPDRRMDSIKLFKPRIGTKVGSPRWVKAKGGIKHALSMIDGKTMSIERKYDGEYCQIHVDLGKIHEKIQIFSKSGKDSTVDRIGVHDAIEQGLRVGKDDCQFSRNCILDGELLVWSAVTGAILDFHKIRKHIARSGTFLGTAEDSPPHPWEHLMIVFYDVLLIDDDPVIHLRHEERRQHLKRLVQRINGKSELVWRQKVDFSKPEGPQKLVAVFAHALTQRWEGLVLKPAGYPYFQANPSTRVRFSASCIKLKKDCIAGIGDTVDLVAIGAAYDGKAAAKLENLNLRWTHFFIACLTNKYDVIEKGAKPSFHVFDCLHDCMKKDDLRAINQHGQFRAMTPNSDGCSKLFQLSYATMGPVQPKMSMVFREPFVFEIAGSGFDKAPDQKIFSPRFPRVVKIHWDRDWRESVSLDELQCLATEARSVTQDRKSSRQKYREWIEKLNRSVRGAEGKKVAWDDTDEEEPSRFRTERNAVAPVAITPSHAMRTAMPAAFVLMDTEEIRPGEKRSRMGQVIKKSTSTKAIAKRETVTSLYRTCSSPPAAKNKEHAKQCIIASGRGTNPIKNPQRAKATTTTTTNPVLSTKKSTTSHKRPLQELTNSARPSQKSHKATTHEGHPTYQTADFKLVRKLSASASILNYNKHHHPPRRSIPMPTSQSQATTDSPPTASQPTTSSQTSPHVISTPPSSLHAPLTTPNDPQLPLLYLIPIPPTPTSTTAHALHTLALHLPDYHPREVYIWDSRILHPPLTLPDEGMGRVKTAEEGYVGSMSLETPADGVGSEGGEFGEALVVLRWADGGETRVELDEVERVVGGR